MTAARAARTVRSMRPSRRPADAYALLGLAPGATRAEIRRAYRRRALEVHPDVASTDTTADMAALNEARDVLLGKAGERTAPHHEAAGEPEAKPGADRPPRPPAYDHAPTWDDYWAAWNDPPRRPRS